MLSRVKYKLENGDNCVLFCDAVMWQQCLRRHQVIFVERSLTTRHFISPGSCLPNISAMARCEDTRQVQSLIL